ncbi:hypothetical protein [Chromobacterium violaceum]|uniref:hypothetical protein n=1 Tax=Chromobacterium violaceum TaxID=536 RepID=UPI0009DA5B8D|nr:hypothetical protein [Chromobacterium violaceum]MBX9269666.1 hypothetical protein [Chromobacterium violaceum]OQS44657.1 hypothetical protein B0T48_21470 [Chromobacterium violaceum]OQS45721.1 hypothetical protein B0T49_20970 [Chromobacterium violaceum]QRO33708.1 hypothetical protein I6K04_02870 [Chromobacterium violaceum]QRQ16488.1 hypothetical protein I6K03_19860 [Chromobacterium violaceum]
MLLIANAPRYGGISKATRSFLDAADYLHWQMKVVDTRSSAAPVREPLLLQATAEALSGVAQAGTDSAPFHLEMAVLRQMGKAGK